MVFTSAAGTMLASAPDMMDPNFMHTVVLICQHSEDGAFGLVVNRQSDLIAEDLLPADSSLAATGLPVYSGGPVGMDAVQFLHRIPDEVPGGIEIFGGLHLGGEVADLGLAVRNRPLEEDLRLFLGYSGWEGGQLEAELASGSWLPAPPRMEAVFASDQRTAWRGVVRSLGDATRGLEDLPPDVSWN